jgi:hypothetical protein
VNNSHTAFPAAGGQQQVSAIEKHSFLNSDASIIAVGLEQIANAMLAAYVINGENRSFVVKVFERVAHGQQVGNAAVYLVEASSDRAQYTLARSYAFVAGRENFRYFV